MLTLKGRQDGFRIRLPKDFLAPQIEAKYSKKLQEARGFIISPIEFLNETIQRVDVLGFNDASMVQSNARRGDPTIYPSRKDPNLFLHGAADSIYRSAANPEALVDKTLNITFRHTLGFLNYMMLFESFLYYYSWDSKSKTLPKEITIDLFDEKGAVYSQIVLSGPVIDGIDMLSFDYTQPVAQSQTFNVIIKYSNFDYRMVEDDALDK